jgi:hypothetical protein
VPFYSHWNIHLGKPVISLAIDQLHVNFLERSPAQGLPPGFVAMNSTSQVDSPSLLSQLGLSSFSFLAIKANFLTSAIFNSKQAILVANTQRQASERIKKTKMYYTCPWLYQRIWSIRWWRFRTAHTCARHLFRGLGGSIRDECLKCFF